ncbi:CBF/NF-Y family transcription factor [Metarhizium album ARSEF 1941]|uniref:DNA polymerase epsilon subunit D n=1 Tax=Metarhizium album (strain ARSEF 1941) TaxID=1081103 RepID=A0A0B2WLV4_METAS|nr:CBF/NF-Y family transcription factor [Metarhizium album ARSEF 1941]KHN94467.1 CBF/NF-Y family transcription factor [Metarhizium album ARSEF 1941]
MSTSQSRGVGPVHPFSTLCDETNCPASSSLVTRRDADADADVAGRSPVPPRLTQARSDGRSPSPRIRRQTRHHPLHLQLDHCAPRTRTRPCRPENQTTLAKATSPSPTTASYPPPRQTNRKHLRRRQKKPPRTGKERERERGKEKEKKKKTPPQSKHVVPLHPQSPSGSSNRRLTPRPTQTQDLTLPRSIITRLAKGVLAPNTQIQANAVLAMSKSATMFINYLASHANENTVNANKKTVAPADVFKALDEIEFSFLKEPLEAEFAKFSQMQTEKRTSYRQKARARHDDTEMAGAAAGAPRAKKPRVELGGAEAEAERDAGTEEEAEVRGDEEDERQDEEEEDNDDDDDDDDEEEQGEEEGEEDEDEGEGEDEEGNQSSHDAQDELEERTTRPDGDRDEALDGDDSD